MRAKIVKENGKYSLYIKSLWWKKWRAAKGFTAMGPYDLKWRELEDAVRYASIITSKIEIDGLSIRRHHDGITEA